MSETASNHQTQPAVEVHFRITNVSDEGIDLLLVDEQGQEWLKFVPLQDLPENDREYKKDQGGIMSIFDLPSEDGTTARRVEYSFIPEESEPVEFGDEDYERISRILGAINTDSD